MNHNMSPSEKRQALKDYADLYLSYQLKLMDARAMGFDTTQALQDELKGYRAELAAPYLIDSNSMHKLMQEAYERNHFALIASHILIGLNRNARPEDTLRAYKTALAVRERLLNGEDFRDVALEMSRKEIKRRLQNNVEPNDGSLNPFTVFDMVYPFESAAFQLKPGEISQPVRTQYGYHIIKLHEKVPFYGRANIQHIWINAQNNPQLAAHRIQEAYRKIEAGENFGIVARDYSDDRTSSTNGGLLPVMALGQIPPEYLGVISSLRVGNISEPFETQHGWHIIRVLDKDTIPSLEQLTPYYKQKLVRDERSDVPKEDFLNQCKRKYHFVDFTQPNTTSKKAMTLASLDEAVEMVNDSVFSKRWTFHETRLRENTPLFIIDEKTYFTKDFLKYIEASQKIELGYDRTLYVNRKYKDFVEQTVLSIADSHLEDENPEFKSLVQEYRDGLMIFAYNDKMVWSKAINDTNGLQQFYNDVQKLHNPNDPKDSVYFWNMRADIELIKIADSHCMTPSQAYKILKRIQKDSNATHKDLTQAMMNAKKGKKCSADTPVSVEYHNAVFGKQAWLKDQEWQPGVYERQGRTGFSLLWVRSVKPVRPKSLHQARGYYISDYQAYLEKELMKTLREKYHATINQEALNKITF